ncbi:unnamed protein product, partial [Musa banksii]
PTRLGSGPNGGGLARSPSGVTDTVGCRDQVMWKLVGASCGEGFHSAALGRNSFVFVPAHRSGRKLGPTPPTIKSMMWIGSKIVPLMASDIVVGVA